MADDGRATQLINGCQCMLGEVLPAATVDRLLAFLDLLSRWNRAYNLTAVREPAEMVSRHLLDSLSVAPFSGGGRLLDVGTGAGLPGIPLAIHDPRLNVTLLDSAGKKVRFLRHVKRELGLENIQPEQSRVEDYAPGLAFDTIISRAFSDLGRFAQATRHLMRSGTRLLAMKGRYPEEEIGRLPPWIRLDRVEELFPPGLQEKRHLVIMSLTA